MVLLVIVCKDEGLLAGCDPIGWVSLNEVTVVPALKAVWSVLLALCTELCVPGGGAAVGAAEATLHVVCLATLPGSGACDELLWCRDLLVSTVLVLLW